MVWQRSGDTGATHPQLMAVRGDPAADERTVNEVAGFVWRLSMLSGAHLTDYRVDPGTVEMIGGPRSCELVRLCVATGLLTVREGGWELIQDPDFIHLRSRADVEWARQQRADTRDLGLVVPVRRRDGDQCRWCGVEVVWAGRKTARSAELDHLRPGEAGTVETMVVACRRCNRARSGNVEEWDTGHELRPSPPRPRYGQATATFLTNNGYPTDPYDDQPPRAHGPGADTAQVIARPPRSGGDTAQASARPAPGPRPVRDGADHAPAEVRPPRTTGHTAPAAARPAPPLGGTATAPVRARPPQTSGDHAPVVRPAPDPGRPARPRGDPITMSAETRTGGTPVGYGSGREYGSGRARGGRRGRRRRRAADEGSSSERRPAT